MGERVSEALRVSGASLTERVRLGARGRSSITQLFHLGAEVGDLRLEGCGGMHPRCELERRMRPCPQRSACSGRLTDLRESVIPGRKRRAYMVALCGTHARGVEPAHALLEVLLQDAPDSLPSEDSIARRDERRHPRTGGDLPRSVPPRTTTSRRLGCDLARVEQQVDLSEGRGEGLGSG